MEQKTNLPGIFLMIAGVLSILAGVGNGLFSMIQGPQANPFTQSYSQANTVGFYIGLGLWVVAIVISSTIVIVAGAKMRNLQSYGLAMTGTILAMIPCCTQPPCCLIALPVGIWSLVVLMDPQVKASFR